MKAILGGLLFLVAGVAVAAAQDACLSGGSLLEDRRALAALRAATEAACPCEIGPQQARSGRRTYMACVRGVIKAQVESGELRKSCRREARTAARSAVCGTDRVACGRYAPGKRRALRCRRAPASGSRACGVQENACAEQTHCTDVLEWTAGTCVDPRQPGPYVAGVRTVQMIKQSVVDPEQERVLDVIVWYPAPPGSAPLSPQLRAVVDAPLDASGGPYPLLLFSHGSCGYPSQSLFLTPLLATQGFIVVAPPHPGNTLADFPACATALVQSFAERPADVIFALDTMLAENEDPVSPFFAAIDAERIGMSGHSFGGLTTYLVAAQDSRIRVALPFAAAVPGQPVLSVPSLTMLGQIDSVVNNTAIRTAYANAQPPKLLVELQNTGHYGWSDLCFPGNPDCSPPLTTTQDEAHETVLQWVMPFLQRYLVGDESFEPFLLGPTRPGVVFDAVR